MSGGVKAMLAILVAAVIGLGVALAVVSADDATTARPPRQPITYPRRRRRPPTTPHETTTATTTSSSRRPSRRRPRPPSRRRPSRRPRRSPTSARSPRAAAAPSPRREHLRARGSGCVESGRSQVRARQSRCWRSQLCRSSRRPPRRPAPCRPMRATASPRSAPPSSSTVGAPRMRARSGGAPIASAPVASTGPASAATAPRWRTGDRRTARAFAACGWSTATILGRALRARPQRPSHKPRGAVSRRRSTGHLPVAEALEAVSDPRRELSGGGADEANAAPDTGGGIPMLALQARDRRWRLDHPGSEGGADLWSAPAVTGRGSVSPSRSPTRRIRRWLPVRITADLNGDGDALDLNERSARFSVPTLKVEGPGGTEDGLAPGDPIPSHLRVGIYHDPGYPCVRYACSVGVDERRHVRTGSVIPMGDDRAAPPMRVLLLSQYFTPEVTAARARAHAFAAGLAARGHEVEVICEVPNHPDGIVHAGYGGALLVDRRELAAFGSPTSGFAPARGRQPGRDCSLRDLRGGGDRGGIAARRPDVVLAISPPLPVGAAAAAIAGSPPGPVGLRRPRPVARGRGGARRARRPPGDPRGERLERASTRSATAIVTVTEPSPRHLGPARERPGRST